MHAPHPETTRPLLVLLSGLGMDHRLVAPQVRAFGDDIRVPPWLPPLPNEALHDYAQRWAPILRASLPTTRPIVLGGLSFGGMVALELAPLLRPATVVLLASARSPRAVPWYLDLLERAAWLTPPRLVQPLLPLAARFMAALERLNGNQRELLRDAFAHCDLPLAFWSARACARWRGADASISCVCPIVAIHGDRDWVLHPDRAAPTHLVHRGRHLINLSRPDEVNAFLALQLVRAAEPLHESPRA